jgi:hypothetical protein
MEWKQIEEHQNYSVNNLGEIKNNKTGRILKQQTDRGGYNSVLLGLGGKRIGIHRLVANAFIPNPDNLPCVDHVDRCKTNNNLSNLRWTTYSNNNRNCNFEDRTGKYSKFVGVTFDKRRNRWVAQIKINNKVKHLGGFDLEEEAGKAFKDFVFQNGLNEFYQFSQDC